MSNTTHSTWHPASQMHDYASTPLLNIRSAQGGWLNAEQGRFFDAISSWWSKSLGHNHPKLTQALIEQAQALSM